MSFFNFFSNKQEGVSIILDLSSGSVGGALVKNFSALNGVMHSVRIPLNISNELSYDKLFLNLLSNAEEVVKTLVHDGHNLHLGHINSAYCFFSPPWYTSRVYHTVITRTEPVLITEPFLKDALLKEKQKESFFLNQTEKEFLSSGKLFAIENKITEFTLNGYKITNPYGKRARVIESNSYTSFSSSEIINKIENIVYKYTHIHTKHQSFMLGLFYFIKQFFTQETEYVIFNLTGEMTDVSFVSRGNIIHTESVLFGRNTILRKISKVFDIGPDLSLSFLRLYSQGKIEKDLSLRISEILKEANEEWTSIFSNLYQNNLIIKPQKQYNRAFVVADDGVDYAFASFLVSSFCIKKEQDAILLSENLLRKLTNFKGVSTDPFLFIEAIHTNGVD